MNILVTGGAGFIGKYVVEKLIEKGHKVTVYDIANPNYSKVEHIQADIFDFVSLSEAVGENDFVIHLTGLPNARIAQKNPMGSFRLNILSLQNLLETSRSRDNKIVFPSSAAVYGRTEDLPVNENHPKNPTNVYAWHKLLCERLVLMYNDNFDVDYVILRLFNVFGRGGGGVINIFLEKAREGEPIEVYGEEQYRDFIYAGDIAEAFCRSVDREKAENQIINIGTGDGLKIKDIPNIITNFYPEANFSFGGGQGQNDYDSIADISLAKELLGIDPKGKKEFVKKKIEEEILERG